jgi:transcription initiation factor TFIID subunit 5
MSASQSPAAQSPANPPVESASDANAVDNVVLEYLKNRGHTAAAQALREIIESGSPQDKSKAPDTVSGEELVKNLAVFAQRPNKPGENILKDSANVQQELTAMANPLAIQNLIASIGTVGAEEILSLDPTDKYGGFQELEGWVEGSLDMYKARVMSSRFTNN